VNDEQIKAKLIADLEAERERPLEWWLIIMSEEDCPKIAIIPARGKYTAFYELQKAGESLDMFYCVSAFEIPRKLVDVIPKEVVGKAMYIWDFLRVLGGEETLMEEDDE